MRLILPQSKSYVLASSVIRAAPNGHLARIAYSSPRRVLRGLLAIEQWHSPVSDDRTRTACRCPTQPDNRGPTLGFSLESVPAPSKSVPLASGSANGETLSPTAGRVA